MIQLDQIPLRLIDAILRAHLPANALVSVFGSRAKNHAKPASDLDLAIDLGRPMSLREHALLTDAFEEAPLAFRIDLVDLRTISEDFRRLIEADLIPLPGFEKTKLHGLAVPGN